MAVVDTPGCCVESVVPGGGRSAGTQRAPVRRCTGSGESLRSRPVTPKSMPSPEAGVGLGGPRALRGSWQWVGTLVSPIAGFRSGACGLFGLRTDGGRRHMVTLGDWGTVYQRLPGDTSFHAPARLRSGHQFRCSPSPAALELS